MSLLKKTLDGIKPADNKAKEAALKRLDALIKPLGSLGELENIAAKISGITGKLHNVIGKKCMIVMSADNGVCEEGVSSCPQEITVIQTVNIVKGISGIGVLARHANADLKVIDIGIKGDLDLKDLVNKKIRQGTSNMAKGPAMSIEEAVKSIETGIETVNELVEEGYNLFGTGEMGIGNTSTSSAVLMGLTGISSHESVGKGAGMTEEGFQLKKKVIEKAIELNRPDKNNPLDVLAKVGGFDIGGMAGCFLGAAYNGVPIVIDGFISAVAALIAYRLNPYVKDYMIPSHISAEPGYKYAINEIGLNPIFDLKMRLGEGTGCPLAFNVIEASLEIINKMATFEESAMDTQYLVDIR
jgi:nicotinate-nucleotide--dimethylbenzimidazole phosphoribosyltransferase